MPSLDWFHERLDEMCARVTAEAVSKADRIIASMDPGEASWTEQKATFRRTGEWVDRSRYSPWELSRIIYPRIIADLDELIGDPTTPPSHAHNLSIARDAGHSLQATLAIEELGAAGQYTDADHVRYAELEVEFQQVREGLRKRPVIGGRSRLGSAR
ncbi:hypothetical protein [Microbacterium sp. 77mftsu3.1]|uniref:hypothetical protein n=1 Tax=Microbacterium sp. 77mftsu3.1 TaxID=1761802 RepID=UPI00035C546F|nr:hypothetical protein [Microbacterium sp. 77mftsu3.1]SDH53595.1 hypothetical protein SAMN04488590_3506 [Microbacterium sp. 77mftsu3.1]